MRCAFNSVPVVMRGSYRTSSYETRRINEPQNWSSISYLLQPPAPRKPEKHSEITCLRYLAAGLRAFRFAAFLFCRGACDRHKVNKPFKLWKIAQQDLKLEG